MATVPAQLDRPRLAGAIAIVGGLLLFLTVVLGLAGIILSFGFGPSFGLTGIATILGYVGIAVIAIGGIWSLLLRYTSPTR